MPTPSSGAPSRQARIAVGGRRRRLAEVIDPKSTSEDLPELNDPVVVVAFEGWNDAGDAATGAVEHLELIWDATPLAALDPEDYYDFQVNRPTVSLIDGVSRAIEWPTTRISVARPPGSDRDVVLIRGIEPNMRWRGFCDELIDDPAELDVQIVVALGALLADTPHTRPTPVTGSAYDAESARAYGLETSPLRGADRHPRRLPGRLRAGRPAGDQLLGRRAALRSQPPSPRATVALLQRVEEVLELTVPLGALPQQADDWVKTVDEMANEDDEVVEYVRSLEERATEVDLSQANGDTIAREFERYLRRRGAPPERRSAESAPSGREPSPGCVERPLCARRCAEGLARATGALAQAGDATWPRCGPEGREAVASSRDARRRRRAGRAWPGRTGRSSPTRSRRPG